MLRSIDYPSSDDVIFIDWHHAGVFANAAASARASFLGASSAPDTYFDGIDNIVGAGDSVAAYNQYKPIIQAHMAAQTKFMVYDAIYDYDLNTMTCFVNFTAEVAPGETGALNRFLQCSGFENQILQCCEPQTGNLVWDHIGRATSASVPITIVNSGETQAYSSSFALDPSWNLNQFELVAFVSKNAGRVNQAKMMVEGHGVTVESLAGTTTSAPGTNDFDAVATYVGAITSDVTVTLDKSGLPAGWDAEIVVGASTFPTSTTFSSMATDDTQAYSIRVIPSGAPGLGTVSVDVAPVGPLGRSDTTEYNLFFNTPSILFVDDDQSFTYETEFLGAITSAGYSYLYTENNPSNAEAVAGIDVVIWNTGQNQGQTIGPNLQANLIDYLDGGGRLFLSSHGYLNHQGTGPAFTGYLGVTAFSQEAQAASATGVPGDPIGDGLNLTLLPPFPDFADAITGIGPNSTIWLNGSNGDVGVRTESGAYRTVFMSAAFEGVAPADEGLVMGRILDWLTEPTGGNGITPLPAATPLALSLSQNAPNPFSGSTSLRFAVPNAGPVKLSVYNVGGQKVVELVNRRMDAGTYSADWDGRDAHGSRVAGGVYFYRLEAGGQNLTKEMVRLR
ncbi:T9SS type A sorting domain-containing protein [bacterium]|nr:T9SS type A sorting domain-containing protein [bacterium]